VPAGVRRAEHGGAKTRFAAERPHPRFDVLIVSCSPLFMRAREERERERESARGGERDGAKGDDINIRDV